ncbi:helix-turn-helix domain-containing protein [Mycobacteroides abscessus]|uniref:helix-turn-helix domain-containing protein n=1 Tax=Mycobacteroides abscessus TaxID=36809 RepID=UPI0006989CC6|nr:helix-turn-helix domain-containing protein [Mycobacteroides abscessus]
MSDTDAMAEALAAFLRAATAGPATSPPPQQQQQKTVYRVDEAAELLCISRAHLYALIRSGEVNSVKLGRSRRITGAEVERLMRGSAA